jgi:hypothetical protein
MFQPAGLLVFTCAADDVTGSFSRVEPSRRMEPRRWSRPTKIG